MVYKQGARLAGRSSARPAQEGEGEGEKTASTITERKERRCAPISSFDIDGGGDVKVRHPNPWPFVLRIYVPRCQVPLFGSESWQ